MAQHRILLVDDEEDLTDSLVRRLRKALPDVEFVGETSSEVALRRIAEQRFSVLVTDIQMPGMDGVELLLRSRRLAPSLKCVLMTAYFTEQVRSEVLRHDAVTYIEKPFELGALVSMLDDILNEAPPSGFKGAMQLETLPDLLQLFVMAHTTGALHVWHRGSSGAIWFDRGELVHAATKERSGVAAFNEIVTWEAGEFSVERDASASERTIFESPTALLMEAYRVLDESRRSTPPHTVRAGSTSNSSRAPKKSQSWLPRAEDPPHDTLPPVTAKSESAALPRRSGANGAVANEERSMGMIDEACREVIHQVDGALACGVVDLDTGTLLGVFDVAAHAQSLNEVIAAAAIDLFRGPNVGRIEQMERAHQGTAGTGVCRVEEIQITSSNSLHFAKVLVDGKTVILLVTTKTTSVGMGWAQLRAAIPSVESKMSSPATLGAA